MKSTKMFSAKPRARRLAQFAAVAAGALVLAACGGQTVSSAGGGGGAPANTEAAGGGDNRNIALIAKGFQHQFWQAVRAGAEERADELGYEITFEGPATETEVDNQLQMLQTAINRAPAAIGFAALDPEACVPLYEQAQQANVPIVEFDAPCSGSELGQGFARTDNLAAGALAAQHMAELMGGTGQIGIVGHSNTNATGVERRDGFVEEIEANFPDIEIVDVQYGDGDQARSADIAKAMLSAYPDLAGIYGTNEGSAIGVVNGVQELGINPGELVIVGFDSGKLQQDAIRSGLMAGAVTQNPVAMGAAVVDLAVAAADGDGSHDTLVDTGAEWYDQSNIDSEDIQAMLYE